MALDSKAVQAAAKETSIQLNQTLSVLTLILEENCTVPFIARYRKERTGNLDEVQIRAISEAYENYIELEKRRAYILDAITKMEMMTPELNKLIVAASTIAVLEDIYAPYKSKKKSKGMIASEAGLLPLAQTILSSPLSFEEIKKSEATKFLKPEAKITTIDEAMNGALDIITEMMAHDTLIKDELRKRVFKEGEITAAKKDDAEKIEEYHKFKDYFEYKGRVSDLMHEKALHRFMAMRRGMSLKVLKVDLLYPVEKAQDLYESKYFPRSKNLGSRETLVKVMTKAYNAYIEPSLDLEVKSELKRLADESAIHVFGVNLKNLLLQPYLGPKSVIGIDPGIRTGCKIAVVDNTGKFLVDTVVYPHPPQNELEGSGRVIELLIQKLKVEYVAIGNGTFGRETLSFLQEYVPSIKNGTINATLVNEAGASVYSASDIAREEFPDKDPTVRGAISIARRFQDPLAELVKIDPKSIGVGQYQHDVNQARLKKSLTDVVESCVNYVGVDLNTASAPLLSFISGIGPTTAANIVKAREKNGGFKSRSELLEVSRFSEKVFEQAAGFLRIYNGINPLDATFIHPERYKILEEWAKEKKIPIADLAARADEISKDRALKEKIGEFTITDIVKSLKAPKQDPRTTFKSTEFRKDTTSMNDLKIGEWYPGVVNNITQFGAFVDIGIKESGLLHISEMADHFVENPLDVLQVGKEVRVRVIGIDKERKRVSLSCKSTGEVDHSFSSGGKGKTSGKPPVDVPIKNNAFAGLKNFKVK